MTKTNRTRATRATTPSQPPPPTPTTPEEVILQALTKFKKLGLPRITRILDAHPITRHPNSPHAPVDPGKLIQSMLDSQLIYQDQSGKYHRMTEAQRNALNSKRKVHYHSDEHEKILRRTRAKMLRLLNHGRPRRNKKFAAELGLPTMAAFKDYLESLFQPGMTWENHGVGAGKWNIDHIQPCASFDLTDPDQFAACWHHTNMRPLWAEDNLKLQIEAKKKRRVDARVEPTHD